MLSVPVGEDLQAVIAPYVARVDLSFIACRVIILSFEDLTSLSLLWVEFSFIEECCWK